MTVEYGVPSFRFEYFELVAVSNISIYDVDILLDITR
nr:hypothetical protein X990_4707 [Burkholderia pseudomallei MSHR4868]